MARRPRVEKRFQPGDHPGEIRLLLDEPAKEVLVLRLDHGRLWFLRNGLPAEIKRRRFSSSIDNRGWSARGSDFSNEGTSIATPLLVEDLLSEPERHPVHLRKAGSGMELSLRLQKRSEATAWNSAMQHVEGLEVRWQLPKLQPGSQVELTETVHTDTSA